MEKWDVYNKEKQLTGKFTYRGKPKPIEDYHYVVMGFISTNDQKLIIDRRSPEKTYPGYWESTGGALVAGDNSKQGIIREVSEELGLDVSSSEGKIIRSYSRSYDSSFHVDVWLFFKDVELDEIVCQEGEVSEAKIVTIDELYELIEAKKFVPNETVNDCLRSIIAEWYVKSWEEDDLEGFLKLLHPDILAVEHTADTFKGIEACKKWFKDWVEGGHKVTKWTITNHYYDPEEDVLIIKWDFSCIYNKVAYRFLGNTIMEFKDNRIIRLREYRMEVGDE